METTFGCEIADIEPFTKEMGDIVAEMQKQLVNETKILEGTLAPVYEEARDKLENELSQPKLTEEQWKNVLLNGFSTTDLIHTSDVVLNTSSSIAEVYIPTCPTELSDEVSDKSQNSCCSEKSEDCGCETGTWNVYSVSTDRMISGLKHGIQNEEK